MEYHLELYKEDKLIFHNNGNWVYPLFDLEKFIVKEKLDPSKLLVKDKIAGRAAAHLMSYIGIKRVHIKLLSKLGLEVYKANGINITWDKLIDRIKCKTETLLENITESEEAYRILKKRAGLFSGIEIECKNLSCGYNNTSVLNNLNLQIAEGDALILQGDNGEGKTTFLKTLSGIIPSVSGKVLFKRKSEIISPGKGKIGLLSQNHDRGTMPILVSEILDSAATLMGLKGEEKDYQIEISLRRTGAIGFYNRIYYELSGGERQRVNLARLICQRAGIFLLDEPATHLDKKGKKVLIDLLHDIHYREMPTILVSTHNRDFIDSLGWNSLYMENGGIFNGTDN